MKSISGRLLLRLVVSKATSFASISTVAGGAARPPRSEPSTNIPSCITDDPIPAAGCGNPGSRPGGSNSRTVDADRHAHHNFGMSSLAPPTIAAPLGATPSSWILTEPYAGLQSQALGLAEAAGLAP